MLSIVVDNAKTKLTSLTNLLHKKLFLPWVGDDYNGFGNGWFAYPNFFTSATGDTFDSDLKIIAQIRP